MRRIRTTLALILVVLALSLDSVASTTFTRREITMAGMIHGMRATHDLSGLRRTHGDVLLCARRHARRMRDAGSVWHSPCADLTGSSLAVEVVGSAQTLHGVARALWRSDAHRSAILWDRARSMAVAVATNSSGRDYIVVVFW